METWTHFYLWTFTAGYKHDVESALNLQENMQFSDFTPIALFGVWKYFYVILHRIIYVITPLCFQKTKITDVEFFSHSHISSLTHNKYKLHVANIKYNWPILSISPYKVSLFIANWIFSKEIIKEKLQFTITDVPNYPYSQFM